MQTGKFYWIIVLSISMFQILQGTHLHWEVICCLSEAQTELHLLHLICQLGSYIKSAISKSRPNPIPPGKCLHTYLISKGFMHLFITPCQLTNIYWIPIFLQELTVLGSVAKRQRVARRQAIMTQKTSAMERDAQGTTGIPQVSLSVEQLTAHPFLKISYLTVSCPRPNTIYIPGYYRQQQICLVWETRVMKAF